MIWYKVGDIELIFNLNWTFSFSDCLGGSWSLFEHLELWKGFLGFFGFWVRLEFLWKLALLKFWFCFRSNRNLCWNRVSWSDLFTRELWGSFSFFEFGVEIFKWVIRFWFWVSDMIGDVWVTWVVLWNNRTFIGKLARTLKFLAVHIRVTLSFFGLTSFWILGWSLLDSIVELLGTYKFCYIGIWLCSDHLMICILRHHREFGSRLIEIFWCYWVWIGASWPLVGISGFGSWFGFVWVAQLFWSIWKVWGPFRVWLEVIRSSLGIRRFWGS